MLAIVSQSACAATSPSLPELGVPNVNEIKNTKANVADQIQTKSDG